jgi:hypothetical protein
MGKTVRAGSAAVKKTSVTILQLFTCLTLSLVAAVVLIKGAIYFDFRDTLSLTLPVIPVLFPLFYKFLGGERGGAVRIIEGALGAASERSTFFKRHFSLRFSEMRSLRRVLIGVVLSLAMKFLMEGFFLYTFYRKSGLPFHALYGGWEDDLVGRFIRGDLLAVTGSQVVPLLAVEALVLTAVGGLWIGFTSPGTPILEGVFAGTILAFFASLTNLSLLYARLDSLAETAASLFGGGYPQVFPLAGPLLQIFFYGCWTMVGQQWRRERSLRSTESGRTPAKSRSR